MLTIRVSIPNTKRDYFDYLVPEPMTLPQIGVRVLVSFRNTERVGIVLGEGTPLKGIKLKPILEVLDNAPFFSDPMLSFYNWLSRYYHAPLSDVLTLALPKRYREGKPLVLDPPKKLKSRESTNPLELNPEQTSAFHILQSALGQYSAFVLDGVTGSGKTEVYLQLAKRVIENNQQVLILVPEIGLTPQLLARFEARFNQPIAVIHSHLTDKARAHAFALAKSEQVSLVIGTRAALFTPIPKLGLIVVDEEHDASFKQQEGIRYSARDAALMRAYLAKVPIILGSATPSLESLYNCTLKKYTRLTLTQKAESQTPLNYQLVDMRAQKLSNGLATPTIKAIEKHIKAGNQVLIFINRRGYAPVLFCHQCGWMADCKHCDSHLTLHQNKNRLICHHCGIKQQIPLVCGTCQSKDILPIGVGTQRIEEHLTERFPDVSIARIDRDKVKQNKALIEELKKIDSGETKLLVGTQMLAKGHHFPNLTLVVIIDVDAGFYNQDFRALERLGQLITQVSGRAGRAKSAGDVIIQTHFPDNPLLNALIQQGYHTFTEALLPLRNQALWPPYQHIALLRASAKNEGALQSFFTKIKRELLLLKLDIEILGPAFAPLARKATQYHMQLLLKSNQRKLLHYALSYVQREYPPHIRTQGVRWVIDVDPVDLA